jgi:hypothetical protein
MAQILTTPTHKEHVPYISCAVQEVDFGQVDCSKENWNRRSLCALKDTINVRFARHYLPTSRRGRFTDNSVPVRGTCDFERGTVTPAKSHRSEIMIQIPVKLLLDYLHQSPRIDRVSVAISARAVERGVRTARIQCATLLQTQKAPLRAKLRYMSINRPTFVLLRSRSGCRSMR